MKLIKKLFGKRNRPQADESEANSVQLPWLEGSDNPWGVELLDLRPITQSMLSSSTDPLMATNAVSYGSDDGTSFVGQEPEITNEISSGISFAIDSVLAPGVLFLPNVMEHKWAIFFHKNTIIFVRSWLRKVIVTAETYQQDGRLVVTKIKGQFSEGDTSEFTEAIVKYLLISHVIGEIFPAPLPSELRSSDLQKAGLWAMSAYGKMAHVGVFSAVFEETTQTPIRSHSLLHIAVAMEDFISIKTQIEKGISINLLAADGLSPLHWALASEDLNVMKHLIELGAEINIKSIEGATPLMNAAQSNRLEKLEWLLSSGADVTSRDNRGFTALHRAAEMGHMEVAEALLIKGAEINVEAEGHTPLSLAKTRNEEKMICLLNRHIS